MLLKLRIFGEDIVKVFRVLAALMGIVLASQVQSATMTFTFTEVGGDVQLDASGSFDISSGTSLGSQVLSGNTIVGAADGLIQLFPANTEVAFYGISVPSLSFGSVGFAGGLPTGNDVIGFCSVAACNNVYGGVLYVPLGYTSGDELSNSATFANNTFAWLGLALGETVFNYGDDDQIIVRVVDSVAQVPVPASLSLMLAGIGGLAFARRRQRSS